MSGEPPPRLARRRRRAARLFVLPSLALLAAAAGYPLALTFGFALTDAGLADLSAARWVGLENFRFALADPDWWLAVRNTLVFTAGSVSLQLALGLAVALLLDQSFRGRGWLRAAVLIPWAVPTVVSAQLWRWMYNDVYGVINALLVDLGLIARPLPWLAEPGLAMVAVIVTDVWKATPFVALVLLAGLQAVPRELYEAARVDGAGALARFRDITLPLLRPTLAVALIFRSLDALRVFDLIYVMTSNSRATATVSVYARQQMIDFQDVGYGSALSVLIFLIAGLVTALYAAVLRPHRLLA